MKPLAAKPESQSSRAIWVLIAALLALAAIILVVVLTRPVRTISSIPEDLGSRMTYEVIQSYSHDPGAFTQGLIYLDGFLYESTGLYGESSLRKVDLETGQAVQQFDLSVDYFAEGLTHWEERLIQLTWREGTGFFYDLVDFNLLGRFTYETEGWGLTQDGERLIMSDGTSTLYFLDPDSFQVIDTVTITYQGEGIQRLNELEYIQGEVYANIWQTDEIIRINPDTGAVIGWIDLRGLLPENERTPETDVLNGIAYDAAEDRLFITGKRWPKLYEIRLVFVSSD